MIAEAILSLAQSADTATKPAPVDTERITRALAWLEPRVDAPEWTVVGAGRANDLGKRIVVDALVGWLELARTDRTADAALLAKLDARIRSHLGNGGGSMGAFANWTDGIAAFYAAERVLRGGTGGRETLAQIVRGFELRQNGEGGWDHGATFGVSFYPSTLVASTNLGLIALGFARRFEIETDPDVIASGLSLLGDVQSAGGGMPYGGRPYTKGVEAGRTCGSLLAFSSLGLGTDPRCTRAAGYVMRNVDAIPDGHASTAFHVLMGALACNALGPAAGKAYDESVLARVRDGQRDDGTFESIVRDSPDEMALMADPDTNRAYVTAFHAAALLAKSTKVGLALQLEKPADAALDHATPIASLKRAWSGDIAHPELVACAGERVLAVDEAGRGRWFSLADGKPAGSVDLALGTQDGNLGSVADAEAVLVWKSPPMTETLVILAGTVHGGGKDDDAVTTLAFVAAAEQGPRWTRKIGGQVAACTFAGEHVLARTVGGHVHVLARADGALAGELPAIGVLPNVSLCAGARDTVVMGVEARLVCMALGKPSDGTSGHGVVWERKNRLRGLTPPAWTVTAHGKEAVVAGRTDGGVVALGALDGATRWEAHTGSSVRGIAIDGAGKRAFVLGHDGRAHAIDEGKLVWTRDVDLGRESHGEPALRLTSDALWIASPARGSIVCLDPKDGRVIGRHMWSRGRSWTARGRTLVLLESDRVEALAVQ